MTDAAPDMIHLAARHGDVPGMYRDAGKTDDFGGIAVPEQYQPLVISAAQRHAVPPAYLAWLLKKESNFNPKAIGPATRYGNAMGMAQFMPGTAKSRKVDPWDPASAIDGAAAYLAELAGKHGSWEGGLARYGTFSTGQGAERDNAVRLAFRQFAATGRFGDSPDARTAMDAGTQVRGQSRVPYYPEPEDMTDPAEALWNAYAEDDTLARILGGKTG